MVLGFSFHGIKNLIHKLFLGLLCEETDDRKDNQAQELGRNKLVDVPKAYILPCKFKCNHICEIREKGKHETGTGRH